MLIRGSDIDSGRQSPQQRLAEKRAAKPTVDGEELHGFFREGISFADICDKTGLTNHALSVQLERFLRKNPEKNVLRHYVDDSAVSEISEQLIYVGGSIGKTLAAVAGRFPEDVIRIVRGYCVGTGE